MGTGSRSHGREQRGRGQEEPYQGGDEDHTERDHSRLEMSQVPVPSQAWGTSDKQLRVMRVGGGGAFSSISARV